MIARISKDNSPSAERAAEIVVLVHGLAMHKLALWPLQRFLTRAGYATLNWGYPSIHRPIPLLAESLTSQLVRLEETDEFQQVHLVTHSMGSIIARQALSEGAVAKLQSLVMLGPPNQGSHVASFFAPGLSWLCPPLRQLSHHRQSYVNQLGVPERIDIGVIAAAHDRVVPVESTHLPGEVDHWVAPSGHNSMLLDRDVAEGVLNFLRHRRFHPAAINEQKLPANSPVKAVHD